MSRRCTQRLDGENKINLWVWCRLFAGLMFRQNIILRMLQY